MEIVLLGTGASLPPVDRGNTFLSIVWEGGLMLVDCGGAPHRRLRYAGLDPGLLRGVLITHDHPDHLYGLPSLLHCLVGDRLREQVLPILAPPDTLKTAHQILDAFGLLTRKAVPISFHALVPEPGSSSSWPAYEADGLRLFVEPVEHSRETVGVRAEAGGRVMAYSSDTGPCEGVAKLARGAHLLVHEATYLERDRDEMSRGHSTALDAGKAAAEADVETLVLAHFRPETIEDPDAVSAEAAQAFGGTIIVGEDFGRYTV